MVVLEIDNGLPDEITPMLLSIENIGCLTLSHKGLVMSPYGLLVLGVIGDMWVNA